MTAIAAQLLGFHVGQVIPYGIYTQDQKSQPGFGTPKVPPYRRIDRQAGRPRPGAQRHRPGRHRPRAQRSIFFTPALGQGDRGRRRPGRGGAVTYGLQLDRRERRRGRRGAGVRQPRAPAARRYDFHAIAPVEAKVDRTVKPLTIALGRVRVVAALAALLIGVQVISRQLRDGRRGPERCCGRSAPLPPPRSPTA